MKKIIKITMLGNFSLRVGDVMIDDNANRSRKVWCLLAYLICNRERIVPQDELIKLLWGDDGNSDNPSGALKTTLYRVRSMLADLAKDMGDDLIIHKSGGYRWNPEVETEVDADVFDKLCRQAFMTEDENERCELLRGAVALYQGGYLNKLGTESWVISAATYYHNNYLKAVDAFLELLQKQKLFNEAEEVCRTALHIDAYQEHLYQQLMRILLALGDNRGAVAVYEVVREILFTNFGVLPDEETQALYREAGKEINDKAVPISEIKDQLREQNMVAGALICDYDFFKVLYRAEARSMERRGDAVHIGLLSVTGRAGKELTQKTLERTMEKLRTHIRGSLRKGDIASRCSISQYILMLPQANYENSCMVCERIIKGFYQKHPSVAAEIKYSVHPLEPAVDEPVWD